MSYLAGLTVRLAAGAVRFPEDFRQRHAAYLAAAQREDGGFPGREGPADVYYTGFGLRGLALLDALGDQAAARAAGFLQARLADPMPSIDFLSWAFSAVLLEAVAGIDVFGAAGLDRRDAVVRGTEPLRRQDGGYAKAESSARSSTYQTFLVTACRQLVGLPIEDAGRISTMIRSRQREDGGFVELDRLPHSGTNPTAAAVGLLRLLGALDESTRAATARFLAGMQGAEGGFRANTQVPMADLLSTFTALVALDDLDALGSLDLEGVRRYVASLELPAGGFLAGAWDDQGDVEYNFYGLGTMAMLDVG
jgi:geranylgeranyl transferase type-2 subunit beta